MEKTEFDQGWGRVPREWIKYKAKLGLNQYDHQLVDVIEYFTMGWSKFSETISNSQFVEYSNIEKGNVSNRLDGLEKRKIIEVKREYWNNTKRLKACRYRLLFDVVVCTDNCDKKEKEKVVWTGREYVSTDNKSCLPGYKSCSHTPPPKTLSKESLRDSPKKEKIYSKFTEEDLEKNRKRALDQVEGLMERFPDVKEM